MIFNLTNLLLINMQTNQAIANFNKLSVINDFLFLIDIEDKLLFLDELKLFVSEYENNEDCCDSHIK